MGGESSLKIELHPQEARESAPPKGKQELKKVIWNDPLNASKRLIAYIGVNDDLTATM